MYLSRMLDLPKRIFWDTNMEHIDWATNARFVIYRVITRGEIKDWVVIKKHYGLERIKQEILQMRDLDDLTLNFFSQYFGIEKEKLRCYTMRQLMPAH